MENMTKVAMITEEAFDNAVKAVLNETFVEAKEHGAGGATGVLAVMAGAMFASKLRKHFFTNDESEGE